jgi:hypothetical protein
MAGVPFLARPDTATDLIESRGIGLLRAGSRLRPWRWSSTSTGGARAPAAATHGHDRLGQSAR